MIQNICSFVSKCTARMRSFLECDQSLNICTYDAFNKFLMMNVADATQIGVNLAKIISEYVTYGDVENIYVLVYGWDIAIKFDNDSDYMSVKCKIHNGVNYEFYTIIYYDDSNFATVVDRNAYQPISKKRFTYNALCTYMSSCTICKRIIINGVYINFQNECDEINMSFCRLCVENGYNSYNIKYITNLPVEKMIL